MLSVLIRKFWEDSLSKTNLSAFSIAFFTKLVNKKSTA